MKTTRKISIAATFAALIAGPMAFARNDPVPMPMDGQMMQGGEMTGGGMMGGNMSGMQGMMQMMHAMGPMMEACTEMIQVMSDQPHSGMPDQKG